MTYNTNAVDGSAVTGITISDGVDRMLINIAGGTVSWADIYAYNVYWLATSAGIVDDGSIITAKDTANYSVTLFRIKNDSATPLKITGGYGVDSVTGSIEDILDVTGGSIFPVPNHVEAKIITVSGANVITGDIADLPTAVEVATATRSELGIELARLDVAVSTRSTGAVPALVDIVDDVLAAVEGSAVVAKEATVASRLAASVYEAPPAAADIATAVWEHALP